MVCLFLVGCAHKKPPPPPLPPPKPKPKGDVLKLLPKEGDAPKAQVKVTIEQEAGLKQGGKSASGKVVFTVTFAEESKVESVAADGTAEVSARLVDAVGETGVGAKPDLVNMVNDFALAIDELHLQLKRSARGEATELTFTGLRKPLEEGSARALFNAAYLAGRGPIFSEEHVEPGATWKSTTPLPAGLGLTGDAMYVYTYKSREGAIAVISCEGSVDAKGAGTVARMTSKSSNELRFDVTAGRLLGNVFDGVTQTEMTITGQQTIATGVKQHIHVEWTSLP